MSGFYNIPNGFSLNQGIGYTENLSNLSIIGINESEYVWVSTLLCFWKKNSNSILTPDGITVVAALGGGNWERLVSTTAFDWLSQASWVVDPVTGNDENIGNASAPLATFSELDRRLSVGAIMQNTTITIPAGATITSGAGLSIDRGTYLLSIVGTPTTIATGTVNTYTDRTHAGAAPEAALLTDLGVADWTPYVGMRIRITSGAQTGAISFIAAANPNGAGLNVARVVRFGGAPSSIGAITAVSPVPGSGYVIESLPTLGGVSLRERNQLAVNPTSSRAFFVSSVDIHNGTVGMLSVDVKPYSRFVVDGCWLDCQCAFTGSAGFSSCVVCRSRLGGPNLPNFNIKGAALWRFVLANPSGFLVSLVLADAWEIDTALFQSCSTGLLVSAVAGVLFSSLFLRDSQFFNCGMAINFQNSGTIFCGLGLSGTGNTYGLTVGDPDNEAQIQQNFSWSQTTDLPNLLGTTTPIRIRVTGGDINLTWAQVPFSSNRQNGVGTLTDGTVIIPARHANTLGVKLSKATPSGNPQGTLTAPTASRTATQFVVNAADATGALVATDQSTFDWEVPGFARPITICQANAIQRPI